MVVALKVYTAAHPIAVEDASGHCADAAVGCEPSAGDQLYAAVVESWCGGCTDVGPDVQPGVLGEILLGSCAQTGCVEAGSTA